MGRQKSGGVENGVLQHEAHRAYLAVGSAADLVTDGGLEIDVDSTWDVLSRGGLAEEGAERVINHAVCFGRSGHSTFRRNPMLEAVKFPAVIACLDTRLAQVNRNALCRRKEKIMVSPWLHRSAAWIDTIAPVDSLTRDNSKQFTWSNW